MNDTPPTPLPPSPAPQNGRPLLTILGRGSFTEAQRIAKILRKETVGGALLVAAAVVAIVWANSPASESYFALRDLKVGYEPWHLELSLGAWAADGLLAIFFFLVGLELKREFVAGDLRQLNKSIVPIAAAVGGVVIPALIYAAVNLTSPDTLRGWAIPTATDIAFAVAVLAIIGSHLPSALRIFLLTLAVVDDLLAITIIAVFYTSELNPVPLLFALHPAGPLRLPGAEVPALLRPPRHGRVGHSAAARDHHLGLGARLRHPRHGGRRTARVRRPRDPFPGQRRPGSRPRAGRNLRAPLPAHFRRRGRSDLRVLLRRRRRGRLGRARHRAD